MQYVYFRSEEKSIYYRKAGQEKSQYRRGGFGVTLAKSFSPIITGTESKHEDRFGEERQDESALF